jgi:PAS domain-containing protein
MPDAFVLTDGKLQIVTANAAFLEAVHAVSVDRLRGRALEEFLGRPGIDLDLILGSSRRTTSRATCPRSCMALMEAAKKSRCRRFGRAKPAGITGSASESSRAVSEICHPRVETCRAPSSS